MGQRWLAGLMLFATALVAGAHAAPADSPADAPRELAVAQTFNDAPFDYRMELLSEREGYRVYRLTYPSPVTTPVVENNTIPADYYLPDGIEAKGPKRPAVICLHILEGNFELAGLTCSVLASRGIPAVMIKLPYYGERSPPEGRRALAANPGLFVEALSQAFEDIRRTIDVLASRPEVDPQRIGIMGISLGGIVAATAAGQDPRLARAALLLAGGDLKRIIHHARETRELSRAIKGLSPQQRASLEESIRAVDPLSHAAGLRERAMRGRVLMINAAEDEVIPRQCTEEFASALGIQDKVIWYEGLGHYSAMAVLPQALRTTADFFAEDLPEQVRTKPPAAAGRTPLGKVAALLSQVGTLLASEPSPGRCHFVDFDVAVTLQDGRRHDAHLRFVRGAKWRFSLRCKLPMLGKAALGQGANPWMASTDKAVFQGVLAEDAEPGNPLASADPQHLMKLRILAGALTAVAIAPDALQRWVIVRDETASDGPPAVRVLRKDNPRDHLRIVFQSDGMTPQSLDFDVEGIRGTVTFRVWQFGTVAHDELFNPPGDLPSQEVDPHDMVRMFSAMFNFAMENVQ